jgi:hypothetical protein
VKAARPEREASYVDSSFEVFVHFAIALDRPVEPIVTEDTDAVALIIDFPC